MHRCRREDEIMLSQDVVYAASAASPAPFFGSERLPIGSIGRSLDVRYDVVFRIDGECCHCDVLLAAIRGSHIHHYGPEEQQVKSAMIVFLTWK
jgi:hypothetical protein